MYSAGLKRKGSGISNAINAFEILLKLARDEFEQHRCVSTLISS